MGAPRARTDCRVCRSRPDAMLELEASWVLISPDDAAFGYACLVFQRHAVELHDLSETEAAAFVRNARTLSAAIALLVEPVKMNYDIHGNTAPHLHMHYFPRYRGDQFEDAPINPRLAARPVYAPGEFDRFAHRLGHALASGAASHGPSVCNACSLGSTSISTQIMSIEELNSIPLPQAPWLQAFREHGVRRRRGLPAWRDRA
jgi:diadenosine tetraphosphate (Ap4A) HIT family hydrolase